MKKAVFLILGILAILSSCNSQNHNNEKNSSHQENENLKIELLFYPSGVTEDLRYSITVTEDSLFVKNYFPRQVSELTQSKTKLSQEHLGYIRKCLAKIKNTEINRTPIFEDSWGATLIINEQKILIQNSFSLDSLKIEYRCIIEYLIKLSPIKIDLYGFS